MKEKLKKFIKKYYKAIIVFICLLITMEMVFALFAKEVMKRDIIGYRLISKYLISDVTLPIAKLITNFGGVIGLIILAIVVSTILIIKKKTLMGILIWVNLACSGLLNQILKRIVQRPRPTEYRLIEENGYSFPSGHSMVSAAFYGFFLYLIFKNVKNKYIKWSSISFLSLLIILIGISRIYLGVHYTSDVMAGFVISISYLVIFTSIVNDYLDKPKEKDKNLKGEIDEINRSNGE